jgi:hypothetical protein
MTHDERDDFPPPSEEEIRESQRLREALEDPSKPSEDADLLRAVKSAAAPKALEPKELEAGVEHALSGFSTRARRGVVIRVAFGGAALVAAAAVVVLVVSRGPVPRAPVAELAHARSTQALFKQGFDMHGGESARIDRIVVARAADLRENRFARWGVGNASGGRR